MAINIPNDAIIMTPRDPIFPIDPVYTGVTGTLDPGTITVMTFGDPLVNANTGGGTTGVLTPVLTSGYVDIKTGIDPCTQKFLGRMINTVTPTGVTDTIAPYFQAVSSNIFDLSNITGQTPTIVNKNAVIKPGYTIYFKDVNGNLNNGGPVLLPNKVDIITGATVYVNGVSIMNQDYRPFKVKYGTYLLTLVSADYTNSKFFYSLTGDIAPSTEKPITTILQDNFANTQPSTRMIDNHEYSVSVIDLVYSQLFGTVKYDVDIILQDQPMGIYYQKGQLYTTIWSDLSPYGISDYYCLNLPVLGELDKGLTFKVTVKQFVSTNAASRLIIFSDTARIISPYQKTYDNGFGIYLIEMNTAETVEIYFDGYDYIVTNMNKQPYMRISDTALSIKDPNMADNNYVEPNIQNLIS